MRKEEAAAAGAAGVERNGGDGEKKDGERLYMTVGKTYTVGRKGTFTPIYTHTKLLFFIHFSLLFLYRRGLRTAILHDLEEAGLIHGETG